MSDNKDYAKMTLEELLVEEKKIKKEITITAVLIGFLIGVMIYGSAKNGFGFLYIVIPIIMIGGISKNAKKLKENLQELQAETNARNNS